jgi:hypothetical protein
MRNALWAEWVIARFTGHTRAASIVGDLLETQRGTLWFCLSVARIVLSVIWRPAMAFVAAFYVGLFWRMFATLAFMRAGHARAERYAFAWWDPSQPLFFVMWFGAVLWTVALYAAIRYGLRDKLAQLALGLCGLIAILVFYWRIPVVTVVCIALGLCMFVASVWSAERSRATMAFTVALAVGFGGGFLSLYLRTILENVFYYRLSGSDLDRTIVNICFWVWAAWITTAACAQMHDRLLWRDPRGEETWSGHEKSS